MISDINMYLRCVVALLVVSSPGWCYPGGPPPSACMDQKPGTAVGEVGMIGHVTLPQNLMPGAHRASPYYIHIYQTASEYQPGQDIQVSIIANQTLGMNQFRGVLMSARRLICTSPSETLVGEEELFGRFINFPTNSPLQAMDCGDGSANAVCQRSRNWKINETVTWRAPDEYVGHIIFRATIVQEATVYWTGVHSRALIDPNVGDEPPTCTAPTITLSITAAITLVATTLINHLQLS